MPRLLDRLTQDHRNLVLMLDLLDKLLDKFHAGEDPDFELLAEMVEYMEVYADGVHHPSEELMYDRMRAILKQGNPTLDVLSNQHSVLVELTRYFGQALESVVHEEVQPRAQVEVQGRDLVATLRNHVNLEESEAFPLAREILTEDDWKVLDEQVSKTIDPLFDERDSSRFRGLYQYLVKQAG